MKTRDRLYMNYPLESLRFARVESALAPIVLVRVDDHDHLALQSVLRALGIGWKRAELQVTVGWRELQGARQRGTAVKWPELCVPVPLAGAALADVIAPLAAAHSALASRRLIRMLPHLAAEFHRLAVRPASPALSGRIPPEKAEAFFARMRDGLSVLGACKLAGLNNRFGHELLKADWGLRDPRIQNRANRRPFPTSGGTNEAVSGAF